MKSFHHTNNKKNMEEDQEIEKTQEFDPSTDQDMSDTWSAFINDKEALSYEIKGDYDKNDLIRQFTRNAGVNADNAHSFVDEVLRIMAAATIKHDRIILRGFGSLYLHEHAPESGIDPNGKPYEVGKRISVEFKASGAFKAAILAAKGVPGI